MRKFIRNFMGDTQGATLIEYGLIAALVAVALVGALGGLESNLSNLFSNVGTELAG